MEVIEQTVRGTARGLKAGQTARVLCPGCEAAHEKAFSVRRDAYEPQKIWFRCWRAACGIHGLVTDADGILLKAIHAKNDEALAAVPVLETMPRQLLQDLSTQLQLNQVDLDRQNLQYDPFTETTYAPWHNLTDWRRVQVGWQTRTADKTIRLVKTDSKAQNYSVPMGQCWRGLTVFVENMWSAYKLQTLGYRAVALLGHRLPPHVASEVRDRDTANPEALVLLDPDCWPTKVSDALRVLESRGWKAHATHISVKPHRMSQEELKAVIA